MIEPLIVGCLFIWGVYISIQDNMIFGEVGNRIRGESQIKGRLYHKYKYKFPSWIKKPLGTCPMCMSSVYGTIIFAVYYFSGHDFNINAIIAYICYVFGLAGLNYLILSYMPQDEDA